MTTDEALAQQLSALIHQLRQHLTWKPGAAARHLLKRKLRGHLPPDSSLLDYEALIYRLLETETAQVYVYYADEIPYLSISAEFDKQEWLVMASFDGVIETAFVVENPEGYMNRPMFRYIGTVAEVVK